MPRRPRRFRPGAVYHVCCRVARGEFIFEAHDEAVRLVEHLKTVKMLDGWTLFAWCLMTNHHRVILRSPAAPLARTFGRIQSGFGR